MTIALTLLNYCFSEEDKRKELEKLLKTLDNKEKWFYRLLALVSRSELTSSSMIQDIYALLAHAEAESANTVIHDIEIQQDIQKDDDKNTLKSAEDTRSGGNRRNPNEGLDFILAGVIILLLQYHKNLLMMFLPHFRRLQTLYALNLPLLDEVLEVGTACTYIFQCEYERAVQIVSTSGKKWSKEMTSMFLKAGLRDIIDPQNFLQESLKGLIRERGLEGEHDTPEADGQVTQ